jgi:hypothetical protein
MKMVKLEDIRIDGGTQFRDQINQDVVKDYGEKMIDGAKFPPIKATFDGTAYWLYDGFHRYFAAHDKGFRDIEVDYKPGTQEDAQDLALKANNEHGLQRNNATKRKVVEAALSMERHASKSDREIAKLCDVSATFVAAVRNPEAKKRQADNVKKHFEKKIEEEGEVKLHSDDELTDERSLTSLDGSEPDEAELQANEMAMQADLEMVSKFLEADDKLAALMEENKRLNFLVSQKEVRIAALMREKSECIKLCKKLQAQVDKINKAKK